MNKGGYAKYIKPFLYGIDLLMVSSLAYYFLSSSIIDIVFIILFWIVLSFFISVLFYLSSFLYTLFIVSPK